MYTVLVYSKHVITRSTHSQASLNHSKHTFLPLEDSFASRKCPGGMEPPHSRWYYGLPYKTHVQKCSTNVIHSNNNMTMSDVPYILTVIKISHWFVNIIHTCAFIK